MRDALDHYDALTAALQKLEGLAACLTAMPPPAGVPDGALDGLGRTMLDLSRQAMQEARDLWSAKEASHADA